MNPFRMKHWSPYVVGALLGLLTWFTFGVAHKALGVSTNFSQAVRLVEEAVAPEHAKGVAYFADYKVPKAIGWEAAIFVGLIVGVAVSAWLSKDQSGAQLPELWVQRFGPSRWKAYGLAFLGGAILIYGARLAGGCTSGHGISGSLQLAVSSWVFFLSLFVSGVATAFVLFRKGA
jgi:uncharacterized membrane protein YedE/YeeE